MRAATWIVLVAAWIFAMPRGGATAVVGFMVSMVLIAAVAGAIVWGVVHLLSRSIWALPAAENALTLAFSAPE
jgi:hypothetical protein